MSGPGRTCPLHYRYAVETFASMPALDTHCLYVAGGVYGNAAALAAIGHMAEATGGRIVFNGDFNWFNVDDRGFSRVNEGVLQHLALRGNVETELADDGSDAGCGCAYPEQVSDEEVARSNRILSRLRETARRFPDLRRRLAALPMYCVMRVGNLRIAIVHGDAQSLAGWSFSHECLHAPGNRDALVSLFGRADVRVFASSHTCLPALWQTRTAQGACAVINNGAAGMPNFAHTRHGVVTRIATTPASPQLRLYGTTIDGVFIDALRVDYDHAAFLRQFRLDWPQASDACLSYSERIANGPPFTAAEALGESAHNANRSICNE
jgi:hypothetical protein